MPEHRRRQATKRSAAIPIGPKGCGGMGPDLAGRGVVLDSTSSTPRRENTAECGASPAGVGSW